MSCKINFKGKEYTESEFLKVASTDKEMIETIYPSPEPKKYTSQTLEMFGRKAQKLQEAMSVKIIFDETIKDSRVLGKNHKMTKSAGKPVIVVNPNNLFKETAIHEFGHIFIDSSKKRLERISI